MHLSNRVTGGVLVVLGAAAAYGGSLLPPVPGQQVGPNVFPMVVGAGLVLCGALIALGMGQRFEEEAEAELAAHTDHENTAAAERRHPLWELRVLIPPALLLFYFFAVDRLGFLLTAATIAAIAALSLRASLRLALGVAIFAPIAVHLIFAKLLRVPLPPGLLPLPW
jgi:putative tricarboxylic transport membrane protein